MWTLYIIHQLAHWVLIWFALEDKRRMVENKEEIYSGKLRWYNWSMIGLTFLMHIVHLIQVIWVKLNESGHFSIFRVSFYHELLIAVSFQFSNCFISDAFYIRWSCSGPNRPIESSFCHHDASFCDVHRISKSRHVSRLATTN